MKLLERKPLFLAVIVCILCVMGQPGRAQGDKGSSLSKKIDEEIAWAMQEGNIPGMSLVMIDSGRETIRSYGYADRAARMPVTANTLFQLGSCTKAFTALAVELLADSGLIDIRLPVAHYLPWFYMLYKDSVVRSITLAELLHHTSGIPWQTISTIPEGGDSLALEHTVRNISGTKLDRVPGKRYEYATINYDILALVIQTVTGRPFEDFIREQVLKPLGLSHTDIGRPADATLVSKGYKIGFFRAREYNAPAYRGNNAAGYIFSDATDMARWLRFQMGLTGSSLYGAAVKTHERDETVGLHGMLSYAMGWEVSLSGNREISHGGLNPNYTAFLAFRTDVHTGIVLLANSNSAFTENVGDRIMKLLAGERPGRRLPAGDGNDRGYSIACIVVAVYILVICILCGVIIRDIAIGKRRLTSEPARSLRRFVSRLCLLIPFLYAIYLVPTAMTGFGWKPALVWSPVSFGVLILLILAAVFLSCVAYVAGLYFPETNKFIKIAPKMVLMSILSGIANIIIIILITSAMDSTMRLRYLVFYYALAMGLCLMGRRFVQVQLIRYSRDLVYELRVEVIGRIFSTSYQRFEKLDRGSIYTALNNDTEALGGAADQFIAIISNICTVGGAFLYLASIAFWTAMLTIGLILAVAVIYYFVGKRTSVYLEEARDTQNVFMNLASGLVDGFKELSVQLNKRLQYKEDISLAAAAYREKVTVSGVRFANAFLVGESLLFLLLGAVVLAIPRLFPQIQSYTIAEFVIVLLYLIGPVNGILSAVPALVQMRVIWRRLRTFSAAIPANIDLTVAPPVREKEVISFSAEAIVFRYHDPGQEDGFRIGPIDFHLTRGEILFITGGNGSGKTTLAKLITGLYAPDEGRLLVNDRPVGDTGLGEWISVVFNPSYLFQRLYNIDVERKREPVRRYLKKLDLDGKVCIEGDRYSTLDLSGGQRRRLALLQCYLEDAPVYLFDEWAADQDPEYRDFFYRSILPEMKAEGKIVIAITHDDRYFGVADKLLRMESGVAYFSINSTPENQFSCTEVIPST